MSQNQDAVETQDLDINPFEGVQRELEESDFSIVLYGKRREDGTLIFKRNITGISAHEFLGIVEDLKMSTFLGLVTTKKD